MYTTWPLQHLGATTLDCSSDDEGMTQAKEYTCSRLFLVEVALRFKVSSPNATWASAVANARSVRKAADRVRTLAGTLSLLLLFSFFQSMRKIRSSEMRTDKFATRFVGEARAELCSRCTRIPSPTTDCSQKLLAARSSHVTGRTDTHATTTIDPSVLRRVHPNILQPCLGNTDPVNMETPLYEHPFRGTNCKQ